MSKQSRYLSAQVIAGKHKKVDNPAGLIIYSLENALPVPASFVSSRKRKAVEETQNRKRLKDQRLLEEQIAYAQWFDEQQDRVVREHYSEEELSLKLVEISRTLSHRDERVRRMTEQSRRDVALRMLRKELAAEVQLPSIEEWRNTSEQTRLF